MKNRHISLQFAKAIYQIDLQGLDGWFVIDIVSDSLHDDITIVQNAILRLKFAQLNGNHDVKWIVVLTDSTVVNLGVRHD